MTTEKNSRTTTNAAIPDGAAIVTTIRNAALSRLETAITKLTQADATDEDFLTAMDYEAGLKAIVREYSDRLKEAAIDYINRHGPVETVTARFYVGTAKTAKCRDVPRAVDAVLQSCGGDFDKLLECLTSNPLKHGACKGVLGDQWERHFMVMESADLKTGAPRKEVKRGLPRGKDGE